MRPFVYMAIAVLAVSVVSNEAYGQKPDPAPATDPQVNDPSKQSTRTPDQAASSGQETKDKQEKTTNQSPDAASSGAPKPVPDISPTVTQQVKNVKAIKDALASDSDLDFSLVVGIASLIVVSGSTDYSDQSNVIHSNNLGKATPQFLAGVAFRSHLANVLPRYWGCPWNSGTTDKNTEGASQQAQSSKPATGKACSYAEPWEKRPWNAFVSVKFAPGSSQTINGFVVGASYSLTKYLSALVGFALTPINEPAPGFRTTAAQFVIAQQKQGQYLNFDPNAMLSNQRNAFDGFPVTDPTGKLIYSGNPLTVHYHGGAVFGVSIPIYFSSAFK